MATTVTGWGWDQHKRALLIALPRCDERSEVQPQSVVMMPYRSELKA